MKIILKELYNKLWIIIKNENIKKDKKNINELIIENNTNEIKINDFAGRQKNVKNNWFIVIIYFSY